MNELLERSISFCKRNGSTILTFGATVGVIATGVTTAKAVPKALKKLDEIKQDKGEELTLIDEAKVIIPYYILPVSIGFGTIMCIFGVNAINKKIQANMSSMYLLLHEQFSKYRHQVIDIYGEEADQKIRDQIVRLNGEFHIIDVDYPDQKMMFRDHFSNRYFEMYERELMDAEYHMNRNFVLRGEASLNEFYEFLGLEPTDYGETHGWTVENADYYWIDFVHEPVKRRDGSVYYEVYSYQKPEEDWCWSEK